MAETTRAVHLSKIPFDVERIGAAALYCSDGRYGEHMDHFLHRGLLLPRYDRVAIPGGAGCLGSHPAAWRDAETLLESLRFLVRTHDLRRIVLIAHDDCGFYGKRLGIAAADVEARQLADLRTAASRIRSCGAVDVEAWFARKCAEGVRFEPLTV